MIIQKNIMNSRIIFENESQSFINLIDTLLHKTLGVKEPGYERTDLYKRKLWDGITSFYNKDDHSFLTGLFPLVDTAFKLLQESQYFDYSIKENFPELFVDNDDIQKPITLLNGEEPDIKLREHQQNSVESALKHNVGIIHAATNAGKTEISAGIIKTLLPYLESNERIVYIVPSKEIFFGAIERFEKRLGISVGYWGDGKKKLDKINVVLVDSLVSAVKNPLNGLKLKGKKRELQLLDEEILSALEPYKINLPTIIPAFLRSYQSKITSKVRQNNANWLMSLVNDGNSNAVIRKELNAKHAEYVKMVKDLSKKKYDKQQEALSLINNTAVLLWDEAHHIKGLGAFSLAQRFTNATYRFGMTGTIDTKEKVLLRRINGIFGDVVYRVTNDYMIDKGYSAKPYIRFVDIKYQSDDIWKKKRFIDAYQLGIVDNTIRNNIIIKITEAMYKKNKTVLIIVSRIEHGENIVNSLNSVGVTSEFINGTLDTDVRKRQLADVASGKLKVIVSTTVLDEGVDISGIRVLIMAAGMKSLRQTLQRVGRTLRVKKEDNTTTIFDFYDRTNEYLYRHSNQRLSIYKDEGFDIKFLN